MKNMNRKTSASTRLLRQVELAEATGGLGSIHKPPPPPPDPGG